MLAYLDVSVMNLNLFEFGFEFNRFPPVTGLTGPANRYRRAAVTGFRLGNKTLSGTRPYCSFIRALPYRRPRHFTMSLTGYGSAITLPAASSRPVLVISTWQLSLQNFSMKKANAFGSWFFSDNVTRQTASYVQCTPSFLCCTSFIMQQQGRLLCSLSLC